MYHPRIEKRRRKRKSYQSKHDSFFQVSFLGKFSLKFETFLRVFSCAVLRYSYPPWALPAPMVMWHYEASIHTLAGKNDDKPKIIKMSKLKA